MRSLTKKNLLAVLLLISAIALILTGFLAFFTDRAETTANGVAGTVAINVDDGVTDADLANINPGDHDWELATYLGYANWDAAGTAITAGTEHELKLEVTNAGNKSVKVRNVIDLIVDFAENNVTLENTDFLFFLTTAGDRIAEDADTAELSLDDAFYLFGAAPKYNVTVFSATGDEDEGYYAVDADGEAITDDEDDDYFFAEDLSTCVGIRYIVFDAATHILQGVGTGAEAEETDGVVSQLTYTYYLGLKASADNRYQGATVDVNWTVEAIQHRNTDSANAWTKITSATTSGRVPARIEDATGSVIEDTP